MYSLAGRVGLVTGGSRGIGRATAVELARAGAAVVIQYKDAEGPAKETALELRTLAGDSHTLQADVASRDEVRRMVRKAGGWKGRLDFVVANAGIYRGSEVNRTSPGEWDEVLQTNLLGMFWTIRDALPFLRRSEHAAAVTVSSILATRTAHGGIPYQSSKAGIEQATRALALELAPGIRVNCVAPGYIRTDMNRAGHEDPEFSHQVVRSTPLGRWGEAADVAPVVRYLLSDEASWVTGAVVLVDGGLGLQ